MRNAPAPPSARDLGRVFHPGKALGVGLVALAGIGSLAWLAAGWWSRSVLAEAVRAVAEGRHAEARRRLEALAVLPWWLGPSRDAVDYPLGVCENALGRPDAAVAAWARVPPDSPFAAEAARRRGETEMDRGRLAVAEEVFTAALRRPGPSATAIRHDLVQLLWQEGRLDEVRGLIERNWIEHCRALGPEAPQALSNLRAHLSLDLEVYTIERVQTLVAAAAHDAPADDRVWLAQANLALRRGQFDEAKGWLDACRKARPDDPVVWRSVLELAMATDQPALAGEAARRLDAGRLPPEQLDRARAWFAARSGDPKAAREVLEGLLAREPGNAPALQRLAELASQADETDYAAELRRRKSEIDQAVRRYGALVASDFRAKGGELARLAETLGRWFEARAFLTLLTRRNPDDPSLRARLAAVEKAMSRRALPARTLAELVGSPPGQVSLASPGPIASESVPAFTEDAEAAGLVFAFENGRTALRQLPETMSGGVGLLDYDGDGLIDVYAVQGGAFPHDPALPGDGDRLFRNKGDGTFEDVTARSGIARFPRGYGHGVAVGDYDNDGHADVLVTRSRAYGLWRNKGDGTFEDATGRAGLGGDRGWPTSAAWADLDNDGDLDLYVCHYVEWDETNPRLCGTEGGGPPLYCVPHLLTPSPDHVFRNDGGRFVDVSKESGVTAGDTDGRGLGVVAADLDDDGLIDLFVANDGTANFLFRNLGGFRFKETGLSAGVAANAEGGYQAGMGIACDDFDGDGRPDLVVTNFYGESSTFYRNLGRGLFADRSSQTGLRGATRFLLGFGTAAVDVNNDGLPDLVTANGHVNDSRPVIPYAMPAQLLLGGAAGRFTDVSQRAGPAWSVPRVGRGLAAGDLDNDGRVDLVVVDQAGPLAFFRNRSGVTRTPGHFVNFRLEGTASNRDAVGARVVVRAGGRRRVAQRVGGGSYQSANEPRLHFGLGPAGRVDEVEVRWPSGGVEKYRDLPADTGYLLREGDDHARPLAGFGGRK